MAHEPIKLDYENPDELRPAGDISPLSQALLGYATLAVLLVASAVTAAFVHWPYAIVVCAILLGAVISSWAHYRLHWTEFAPAMGIALSLILCTLAALGIGWFILKII